MNTNNPKRRKAAEAMSRRAFLNRAATGAAAAILTPATSLIAAPIPMPRADAWPAEAPRYTFYMIGHAHIDPVWLWPWTEGVAVIHSTFRSALDRMNETPEVGFVASSAQFYQWVADNDPKMLAEIRKRIQDGHWNMVGGWWVEPDMNMPSGEAMVRQGLYGQLTMQRLFGRKATTAFCADSFGHAGSVPQILRQQGMENYSFLRPGTHEKTLPAELFWWEGIDGSKVMAYRIQYSYEVDHRRESDGNGRMRRVITEFSGQPIKSFIQFYGMGDHGGGPTKENIRLINALAKEPGAPRIIHSTLDKYFADMRADKSLNIPTVKDDLQHHGVGCYTAEWEIKKGNRQSEAALITTEKIAAIGAVAWGVAYPKKELTAAWQRVLFMQFHDSLAGTSVVEHSQDARESYGFALDTAHQAMHLAVQKLEWQIPAEDPDSEYMIAFNPHAWDVTANVAHDFGWMRQWKQETSRVTDDTGRALPFQIVNASSVIGHIKLLTQVTIPAMGYRQIRMTKGEPLAISRPAAIADGNILENEFYKISFSKNGAIGIFDKENGSEVFAKGATGCRAVIIDDPSDTWSHRVVQYADEIGMFGDASTKVLERGLLRATVRVTSTYHLSTLTVDWSLTAGRRNIEAKVTLDWHERLKMLKFSFPVNVESPVATYEIPYGNFVRHPNGDEEPGQRWIDVYGERAGKMCGLTVLNDAKYGYSVNMNDMRVTMVRGAPFAHHEPHQLRDDQEYVWMEQGMQTFRMMLVPHADTWKQAGIARTAEEFMSPPATMYQGIHGGVLPKSGSYMSIDNPAVIVTAVKQAEDNNDVIIRMVETSGDTATAVLNLGFINRKWTGNFRAYEIKSLRVNTKNGNVKEVNLLEE